MGEHETLDWETFEQRIKKLRATHQKESSPLLFRGQGNSEWPLTTTLERSGAPRMLFRDYYGLICASIGPMVKTLAGTDVPEYDPEACKPFLDPALLYEIPRHLSNKSISVYGSLAAFWIPIAAARLVAHTFRGGILRLPGRRARQQTREKVDFCLL
jgi:hypothetical protein